MCLLCCHVHCVRLQVLSDAPNLRRLMMGNTNITGRIPCRLFEDHKMKTVMFSVNQLEGPLPACVLEVSRRSRHACIPCIALHARGH
jgi:hypothetical protein